MSHPPTVLMKTKGQKKKLSLTDRQKVKVEQFLEGADDIQRDLQQRQHEFEAAQSMKYQEWKEKREQERNKFYTTMEL